MAVSTNHSNDWSLKSNLLGQIQDIRPRCNWCHWIYSNLPTKISEISAMIFLTRLSLDPHRSDWSLKMCEI